MAKVDANDVEFVFASPSRQPTGEPISFSSDVLGEFALWLLDFATHGVHYDSRYWDSEYQPEKHSYVDAALEAGYSTLTYDRLGVGRSDKPDAYTVVQAPLELEILRQLTLMARNGTLYNFAGTQNLQMQHSTNWQNRGRLYTSITASDHP